MRSCADPQLVFLCACLSLEGLTRDSGVTIQRDHGLAAPCGTRNGRSRSADSKLAQTSNGAHALAVAALPLAVWAVSQGDELAGRQG